MIDWQSLLEKLEIENKDIVFSYFVVYSRFEYALKRSDCIKKSRSGVSADWEKFIKNIKSLFDQNRTNDLSVAVSYLLENPPEIQEIDQACQLIFVPHITTTQGPIPLRLYHCTRIVRNNLFHGGKYHDGPRKDMARDSELLRYCHIILQEFLYLDKALKGVFEETAR